MRASLLLAAMLLCAPAAMGQSAAQVYEQASRFFSQHKYQECMDSLDEALKLDPKLVPALTLRAKLAMAIKRYDVARENLESAIAADPKSAYARFLYGFQYYEQNEMPGAIAAFQKARELNSRDPQATLYLGLAYEAVGRTADALGMYRLAIQLEDAAGSTRADTLLTCARLLMLLDQLDECGKLIGRAAKVAPDSRDPHFEQGRLWMKKGDAAHAIAEGEAALKLHSGDVTERQLRYLLVQAYGAAGNEREAARNAAELRRLELSGK